MKHQLPKIAAVAAATLTFALPLRAAITLYVDTVNDQFWFSGSTDVTPLVQNSGGFGRPETWQSQMLWQSPSGGANIYNSTQYNVLSAFTTNYTTGKFILDFGNHRAAIWFKVDSQLSPHTITALPTQKFGKNDVLQGITNGQSNTDQSTYDSGWAELESQIGTILTVSRGTCTEGIEIVDAASVPEPFTSAGFVEVLALGAAFALRRAKRAGKE